MLGNSIVVVVRRRPRAIPLAMITMRKSTHGIPFLSYMSIALLSTTGKCLVSLTLHYVSISMLFTSHFNAFFIV